MFPTVKTVQTLDFWFPTQVELDNVMRMGQYTYIENYKTNKLNRVIKKISKLTSSYNYNYLLN